MPSYFVEFLVRLDPEREAKLRAIGEGNRHQALRLLLDNHKAPVDLTILSSSQKKELDAR
jgi:hypothetical protein